MKNEYEAYAVVILNFLMIQYIAQIGDAKTITRFFNSSTRCFTIFYL